MRCESLRHLAMHFKAFKLVKNAFYFSSSHTRFSRAYFKLVDYAKRKVRVVVGTAIRKCHPQLKRTAFVISRVARKCPISNDNCRKSIVPKRPRDKEVLSFCGFQRTI